MGLNLYFKTDEFRSNKELAHFIHAELGKVGYSLSEAQDEDYMFSIEASAEDEKIHFYMGKNDEPGSPQLWQIWPEQKVSIIKKLFGKVNKEPENLAKKHLENIVNKIHGVSGVEWGI